MTDGTRGRRRPHYSAGLRERAVRMVREARGDHPSQCAAVCSVAGKIGCTRPSARWRGGITPRWSRERGGHVMGV